MRNLAFEPFYVAGPYGKCFQRSNIKAEKANWINTVFFFSFCILKWNLNGYRLTAQRLLYRACLRLSSETSSCYPNYTCV